MTEPTTNPMTAGDIDTVWFLAKPRRKPGDVKLHAGEGAFVHLVDRPLRDVEADVARVTTQIKRMVEEALKAEPLGMALDGIEIGLAFSAKGELLFIAEAGVEASVRLSYKPARPAGGASG